MNVNRVCGQAMCNLLSQKKGQRLAHSAFKDHQLNTHSLRDGEGHTDKCTHKIVKIPTIKADRHSCHRL